MHAEHHAAPDSAKRQTWHGEQESHTGGVFHDALTDAHAPHGAQHGLAKAHSIHAPAQAAHAAHGQVKPLNQTTGRGGGAMHTAHHATGATGAMHGANNTKRQSLHNGLGEDMVGLAPAASPSRAPAGGAAARGGGGHAHQDATCMIETHQDLLRSPSSSSHTSHTSQSSHSHPHSGHSNTHSHTGQETGPSSLLSTGAGADSSTHTGPRASVHMGSSSSGKLQKQMSVTHKRSSGSQVHVGGGHEFEIDHLSPEEYEFEMRGRGRGANSGGHEGLGLAGVGLQGRSSDGGGHNGVAHGGGDGANGGVVASSVQSQVLHALDKAATRLSKAAKMISNSKLPPSNSAQQRAAAGPALPPFLPLAAVAALNGGGGGNGGSRTGAQNTPRATYSGNNIGAITASLDAQYALLSSQPHNISASELRFTTRTSGNGVGGGGGGGAYEKGTGGGGRGLPVLTTMHMRPHGATAAEHAGGKGGAGPAGDGALPAITNRKSNPVKALRA